MSKSREDLSAGTRPSHMVQAGFVARLGILLLLAAEVARTLTDEDTQGHLPEYATLMAAYLLLFALTGWKTRLPRWLLHAYFVLQSCLVAAMVAVNPEVDAVTAFYIPLAFQAALFFAGRLLWLWVVLLALLNAGVLVFFLGALRGLALAMVPMAFVIALPVLMVANHEAEEGRRRSQVMLEGLHSIQSRLQAYAGQVEELASLQERSRLARELHDTVSQLVFTTTLTARSAQLMLPHTPARVRVELDRLREISGNALSQLRSLISQMRP